MEVAFSNLARSPAVKPRKNPQGAFFHRMAWKTIGKRAAILAFALYLPLSSPIMTSCSCSSQQSRREEAAKEAAIANVDKLRQAKGMFTPTIKALAKNMSCVDFQPLYDEGCVFYWSKQLCVGKFIFAQGIIQRYGINAQDADLVTGGKNGVVRLSNAVFDAKIIACARQAAQSSGLEYRLMLNRELPVLYFVFPDNVLLIVYGTATEKKATNDNDARHAAKKGETFGDEAKKIGKGIAVLGLAGLIQDYGSAYEIPMLLVLGVTAGAVAIVGGTVGWAADKALDAIDPGRHAPPAAISQISDLVLDTKKIEMKDRDNDIIGYRDETVSVADITVFSGYTFFLADEDMTVTGRTAGTTAMGFVKMKRTDIPNEANSIGFNIYEPGTYDVQFGLWRLERYVHWYNLETFNRIKQSLESRGIGYILIFQPKTNYLIFLTDTNNVAICIQQIDVLGSLGGYY